jgi:transcriptional regulator with XRE-family HTH domain
MKKNLNRPIFALNLIKFRKSRGYSQTDLANLTGLSARVIAYYETEALNPPIDKIKILADALGIKVSDLIEENNNNQELINIDPRILKISMMLEKLNRHDKETIYNLIKSLYNKQKKLKQLQESE